jgi:hypothetical protein
MTIIVWVYPEGKGPILHYNTKGWGGVHLWMASADTILAKFVPRKQRAVSTISSRGIKPRQWNYLAATYEYKSGVATLWKDSSPIAQRRIGTFELATNFPAIMGLKKVGGRSAFKGRISCLHIYNRALNGKQIAKLEKKCFRGKNWFKVHDYDLIIFQTRY